MSHTVVCHYLLGKTFEVQSNKLDRRNFFVVSLAAQEFSVSCLFAPIFRSFPFREHDEIFAREGAWLPEWRERSIAATVCETGHSIANGGFNLVARVRRLSKD